jgi:ribonuclease P protein component
MLPKQFRLPHHDIADLFKNGAKFYFPEVQFICRKKIGISRLAIRVPATVCKKAVDRNRCKRTIREFFRHTADKLIVPIDIIIIVRRDLSNITQTEINKLFMEKFHQIKII